MEISEDEEDENFMYEELPPPEDEEDLEDESDEEDLNNFEALKAKTNMKLQTKGNPISIISLAGAPESVKTYKPEPKPKVIEREVVIDDYIRNFLRRYGMAKTLNIFE